jgi:hypothetical protein
VSIINLRGFSLVFSHAIASSQSVSDSTIVGISLIVFISICVVHEFVSETHDPITESIIVQDHQFVTSLQVKILPVRTISYIHVHTTDQVITLQEVITGVIVHDHAV